MTLTVFVAYNQSKAVVSAEPQTTDPVTAAVRHSPVVECRSPRSVWPAKSQPPSSLSVLGITALASGSSVR